MPYTFYIILHVTGIAFTFTALGGAAMANAAGVRAVAVRSGVHDETRLRGFGPHAVLDGVADLLPWLDFPVSLRPHLVLDGLRLALP